MNAYESKMFRIFLRHSVFSDAFWRNKDWLIEWLTAYAISIHDMFKTRRNNVKRVGGPGKHEDTKYKMAGH